MNVLPSQSISSHGHPPQPQPANPNFNANSSANSFRTNLAKLISPFRRVRTHTPFFRLAAHRVPTLWGLYRGLLRAAPDEQVKFRVRLAFRENRHSTSPKDTKAQLELWYKRLDFFKLAAQGSQHHRDVLKRYSTLILLRRDRARMTRLYLEDQDFLESRRNQPIITGSYIRPSVLNPPLPRVKPQPEATSMIFMKRRRARESRHLRREILEEWMRDLECEAGLERALAFGGMRSGRGGIQGDGEGVYCGDALKEWKQPLEDAIALIRESQTREYTRATMAFPPSLIQLVQRARRERQRNLTHANIRERRGEVLPRTLQRMRKGPPAHILARMTPEQRDMDRVSRSVSEVGYVALVKRRLGWKLRSRKDVDAEEGREENRELLDRALRALRRENERREREEEKMLVDLEKKESIN